MKNLLNLGNVLNIAEQRAINGGGRIVPCALEYGGCPCNCYWDENNQCVTELVFTRPCD